MVPIAAGAKSTYFKQGRDLLGENSFSRHACVPLRIIQPVTAQMPDPPQHFVFTIWKMFLQPMLEQWRNRPRQTDNCVAGKLRASFCASIQDLGNLMIIEPGDNWRDHHANWNFRCTKLFDRLEPPLRRCRARFQDSLQRWIERSH